MRHFLYSYQTCVTFSHPITNHAFRLRCQPTETAVQQILKQDLTVSPGCWLLTGQDGLGNRTVTGGNNAPHSAFAYLSSGLVAIDDTAVQASGNDCLYRFHTQLTAPVAEFASLETPLGSTFDKAALICQQVNQLISYQPGVTAATTPVSGVMEHKQGVCQDYAHVMVSVCRFFHLPARYVCGLMLGEGATHAWVEVSDGNEWRPYDPTNNCMATNGYIKLAHGRDALDCSVCNGFFQGNATQNTNVSVSVFEV